VVVGDGTGRVVVVVFADDVALFGFGGDEAHGFFLSLFSFCRCWVSGEWVGRDNVAVVGCRDDFSE